MEVVDDQSAWQLPTKEVTADVIITETGSKD